MWGVRRLRQQQPPTARPVVELAVSNGFGRWMRRQGWLAFTLPLPFLTIVFYWMLDTADRPSGHVRVHEFVHVRQAERLACFSLRYLWAHARDGGYRANRFEREAFRIEAEAVAEGLPAWAADEG